MKPIREVVSRDVIEDLWGAGYTILPRRRHSDPFHVPEDMIPQGRSYQWMHLVYDQALFKSNGPMPNAWAPVPASRHDGYFMPAGHIGDIEVNGLGLFEKPKFEVEAERASQVAAAHKQVDDWKEKWGGEFSGSVTVGTQTKLGELDSIKTTEIGSTKTIENTTKVPRDMVPHIAQIFEERDRLYTDLVDKWNNGEELNEQQDWVRRIYQTTEDADPNILKGPTLNAILLPIAIANIRTKLAEEAADGQAS